MMRHKTEKKRLTLGSFILRMVIASIICSIISSVISTNRHSSYAMQRQPYSIGSQIVDTNADEEETNADIETVSTSTFSTKLPKRVWIEYKVDLNDEQIAISYARNLGAIYSSNGVDEYLWSKDAKGNVDQVHFRSYGTAAFTSANIADIVDFAGSSILLDADVCDTLDNLTDYARFAAPLESRFWIDSLIDLSGRSVDATAYIIGNSTVAGRECTEYSIPLAGVMYDFSIDNATGCCMKIGYFGQSGGMYSTFQHNTLFLVTAFNEGDFILPNHEDRSIEPQNSGISFLK
ncbi:MAG: hypothetical protein FWH33_06330 [Oscillospiraceae bacterium]|nr:hypothetical protein [Oscillospiraceae bacterium]